MIKRAAEKRRLESIVIHQSRILFGCVVLFNCLILLLLELFKNQKQLQSSYKISMEELVELLKQQDYNEVRVSLINLMFLYYFH